MKTAQGYNMDIDENPYVSYRIERPESEMKEHVMNKFSIRD